MQSTGASTSSLTISWRGDMVMLQAPRAVPVLTKPARPACYAGEPPGSQEHGGRPQYKRPCPPLFSLCSLCPLWLKQTPQRPLLPHCNLSSTPLHIFIFPSFCHKTPPSAGNSLSDALPHRCKIRSRGAWSGRPSRGTSSTLAKSVSSPGHLSSRMSRKVRSWSACSRTKLVTSISAYLAWLVKDMWPTGGEAKVMAPIPVRRGNARRSLRHEVPGAPWRRRWPGSRVP